MYVFTYDFFYHFIAFIIIAYLLWTFLSEIKPD